MATPTRGRTLKYLSVHEARYAIAAVARDGASGDVTEAVCLFCKHFGREQRADKKRKNSSTVKYFRDSFRPDQYTQHHQLQHPTQWKRYKCSSEKEKLQFFPVKKTTISTKLTSQQCPAEQTPEEPLIPNAEERGRCFDLKAEIVEVVAVLAQGLGLLNSTVETRDRRTYQYMLHHDAEEEEHTNCPRWSPPPDTFQSCKLVQREPPVYRVVVYSKKQMDLLMGMAAQGLSAAQIAQSLKVFRGHASTLLGDVVGDAAKMLPILNRDSVLAMEQATENAKEKQPVTAMTPMYNHAQTAEFVRLGIATSMSIIARLMEDSWAFSLELCTVAQHSRYSYLDVRVKFYNRVCGLRSAHLIAIPRYIGKCDLMMFQTLERVLTSVFPKWRKRLLGITTGGDIAIPARIDDLIRHFQGAASGPALHRANYCCKQLQRVLNTFSASIDNGRFLLKFKVLSEYVRKEPSVLSDMKKYPGYRDRLDSDKHNYFDTPRSFGQEVDMIMIHRGLIQGHFKVTNPLAEPPVSWWLALEILHWITTRFNALFAALEKPHVTISQQGTEVASLAEECITGFRAQIRTEKNSGVKTRANEFISNDGRVILIKSGMLDFAMDLSTLALELVKNGGAATVHATTENLAAGAANMIASLVELSIHLKRQHAACIKHPGNNGRHAVEVTDTLPPVLPHQLARLNTTEFIELLQASKITSRGFLNEGDIKIVCDEHEMLRHHFAEVSEFKVALQSCTQDTRFGVAWGLTGGRYKCLEAFAGGLATVLPSDAINLSDASLGDLVLCPEDTEESRLLFANLEMESALHAQQFQPLIKLQEEMYDMLLEGKRTRKRMKTSIFQEIFDRHHHASWIQIEAGSSFLDRRRQTHIQQLDQMQFFASQGKESLAAAALEASMRSVRMCGANANDFDLEEHQRWCDATVRERVALKVSSPEARGTYLQKHTTYLVTQEPLQEGVRRRFRDFEWLRAVLHARYVGLLVPSLPDKTTTATVIKNDAFLQSRMRGLQRFLNELMQSPYLRCDAAVASFLGEPGDEATWEAMRKGTAVMDNAGEGHMRWLQRILCEHIASSPDDEISVFKRHVEQRERLLGELAACAKRLADRSAAMAKDVNTLHAIFAGWQLAETGAGSFVERNDAPLVSLLDKSTATISGWSQVESFHPAIYELLLLENIKYMLHQATAMKQMLVQRERAIAGESSPERKPSPPPSESPASPPTSGFSVASFTSAASSAASKFMSAVEPPSLSAEEQQRRAHHTSELITRALMAEEMQRFRSETTKALESIMNHFSCAEAQLTKRSMSVWREYLKTSPADPQTLAQSTKELLDSASASSNSPLPPSAADAF